MLLIISQDRSRPVPKEIMLSCFTEGRDPRYYQLNNLPVVTGRDLSLDNRQSSGRIQLPFCLFLILKNPLCHFAELFIFFPSFGYGFAEMLLFPEQPAVVFK